MSRGILWRSFAFSGRPADLLTELAGERRLFLLESSQRHPHCGRYSFLGFDPFAEWSPRRGEDLTRLRREFVRYAQLITPDARHPSPLPAGIVGYLSYDYGTGLQGRGRPAFAADRPEALFGFYDGIITIDHAAKRLWVSSSGLPETDSSRRQKRAQERLGLICGKIQNAIRAPRRAGRPADGRPRLEREPSALSRPAYLAAVRRILKHIAVGDIYQANFSRRISWQAGRNLGPIDAAALYQQLRRHSPSPFAAYFDAGPLQIVSSSPERFLCLEGNRIETRPMKGTRPRGMTAPADARLAGELLRSAKDKAELLMITDLLRNDLGRVCEFGSIRVAARRTLERYRTVFQTTSTVVGTLRPDCDAFDAIAACFPGGSITGCPKLRAIEILDAEEPEPRFVYTGSLGYLSFTGGMDLNIMIRTLLLQGRCLETHVGGGIVADSTPAGEYQETEVKAAALEAALAAVSDGNDVMNARAWRWKDRKFVEDGTLFAPPVYPWTVKGQGVFETMRVDEGRLPLWPLHRRRLLQSLTKIGVPLPAGFSGAAMSRQVQEAASLASEPARMRLMVWSHRGRSEAVMQVFPEPHNRWPDREGLRAAYVTVTKVKPFRKPRVKSIDYKFFQEAWEQVGRQGFGEAVLVNRHRVVIEGSRANVFMVKDGIVLTPALEHGALNGVARRVLIDLARINGITLREARLRQEDLDAADEIFFTNAVKGLVPVIALGDRTVGVGRTGPVTANLQRIFEERLARGPALVEA